MTAWIGGGGGGGDKADRFGGRRGGDESDCGPTRRKIVPEGWGGSRPGPILVKFGEYNFTPGRGGRGGGGAGGGCGETEKLGTYCQRQRRSERSRKK